MDGSTFDRLARAVGYGGTRRRLLGLVAGLPLVGILASLEDEASEAKRRRHGRRRSHRPGKGKEHRKGKRKGHGGGSGGPQACDAGAAEPCPNGAPCCRKGCAEEAGDRCCDADHGPASGFCQFNFPICCAPGLGGPGRCCPNGASCCPPGMGDPANGCCFTPETACAPRTARYPGGCCPFDEGASLCGGEKNECCPDGRDCCGDGSCCEGRSCCGDTCCADGQTCVDNVCVCNATSCPNGCCEGTACRDGGDNQHCGSDGVACAECTGRQVCGQIGPPMRNVCCFPPGTSGVCTDENYQTVCCLDDGGATGCEPSTGTCLGA